MGFFWLTLPIHSLNTRQLALISPLLSRILSPWHLFSWFASVVAISVYLLQLWWLFLSSWPLQTTSLLPAYSHFSMHTSTFPTHTSTSAPIVSYPTQWCSTICRTWHLLDPSSSAWASSRPHLVSLSSTYRYSALSSSVWAAWTSRTFFEPFFW